MKLSEVIEKEIEKARGHHAACRRLGSEYLQKAKENDELADAYSLEIMRMMEVFRFAQQLENGEEPVTKFTNEETDKIKNSIGVTLDFAGDGPAQEGPDEEAITYEDEAELRKKSWLDKTIESPGTFQPDSSFEMPTKWSDVEIMMYHELEYIWRDADPSQRQKVNAALSDRSMHLLHYVRVETAKFLNIVVPNYLLINGD